MAQTHYLYVAGGREADAGSAGIACSARLFLLTELLVNERLRGELAKKEVFHVTTALHGGFGARRKSETLRESP